VSRPATKAALKIRSVMVAFTSTDPVPQGVCESPKLLARGAAHHATQMTLPAGKATTVTEGHD
jgi:hypothetical protein